MPSTSELLRSINAYCDLAPRATASAEAVGPFTVFVARTGWPFYARPALEQPVDAPYRASEVRAVFGRQQALGIPLQLEWIHDRAPALADAITAAGGSCVPRPLLVRTSSAPVAVPDGVTIELLEPDDSRFEQARAAVSAGFGETDELSDEPMADTLRARAAEGLLRVFGAFGADGAPLGGGTAVPRDRVSELVGIAVRPSARGRGIGAALTCALAADTTAAGARTVWLSATDEQVARVYERAGFTRIGTAMEAEAPAL